MGLNVDLLDKVYKIYGFKIVKNYPNIRVYLFEEGRYYGADIIPLNDLNNTLEICKTLKKDFADGGYAVQLREYSDNLEAEEELYKSFFSYEATSKRIKNKYVEFAKTQSKLNGARYSYVNGPFLLNNEYQTNNDIVATVNTLLDQKCAQLVIIEAAAGYGKTCTAYEILNSLLESNFCDNPLFTELSRNRGANIFRYVLLDEIDREYPSLDSSLVNYEIQAGRIPLIIDGFDELLNKSDIVKSDKTEIFAEVETMLDTIGKLLKGEAKVILTTRKTAIFSGEPFLKWTAKWNNNFEVNRLSIEVPKIKDWLGSNRLKQIRDAQIPMEYLANPVLLTYLKNLDNSTFSSLLNSPDTIVKQYFFALLNREIVRQDLRISADEQYSIFKNVVKMLIEFDQSAEKRGFLREIIIDQNKEVLERALGLYPSGTSIDVIADKLITHALLDRKGGKDDLIGFINEFVFGTFIGELMSEVSKEEIEKTFSAYMVEIGATAYRVQNLTNKKHLWDKIETLKHKFEPHVLFNFDVTLRGEVLRNFEETIFQSLSVYNIYFPSNYSISSSVFMNCQFKNCVFESNAFNSVSFIECHFEDCSIQGGDFLDDDNNIYAIKCTEKNCKLFSSTLQFFGEAGKIAEEEFENSLLSEIYQMEQSHQSQRIMKLMRKHNKSEHKKVSRTIDNLVKKKIIAIAGSEMYIEMNKLPEVKKRIGIK